MEANKDAFSQITRLIKTHPFDLSPRQVEAHTSVYKQSKGTTRSQAKMPVARIRDVIEQVRPHIQMSNSQWQDLMNQFDSQDLDAKISFSDFLQLLQRESFFREALSEIQIYRQSAKRLAANSEFQLITEKHLDFLKAKKKQGDFENIKIPSFAHQIEKILTFEMTDSEFLLVSFENKQVQLFDLHTGLYVHEFDFREYNMDEAADEKSDREDDLRKKTVKFSKATSQSSSRNLRVGELSSSNKIEQSIDPKKFGNLLGGARLVSGRQSKTGEKNFPASTRQRTQKNLVTAPSKTPKTSKTASFEADFVIDTQEGLKQKRSQQATTYRQQKTQGLSKKPTFLPNGLKGRLFENCGFTAAKRCQLKCNCHTTRNAETPLCANCSSVLETSTVNNVVLPLMKQETTMDQYKDRLSKDWLLKVRNRVTSTKVAGIGQLGIGDATIWSADPAEQAKDSAETTSASVLSKHAEKNKGFDKKVFDFIKRRKKTRKAEPYGIEDRFFSFLNFDEKSEIDYLSEMYRLKANFDAAEEHLKTLNMRQPQVLAASNPSKNSKRAPKILLSTTDEIQHQLQALFTNSERVSNKVQDVYNKTTPQVQKLNRHIFLMRDWEHQKLAEEKGLLYEPGQDNQDAAEIDRREKTNPRFYKSRFPNTEYTNRDLRKEMQAKRQKNREVEETMKIIRSKVEEPDKKTYPMCIAVYEPLNLLVFAMVNKQVVIMQVKQAGQKRNFHVKKVFKLDDEMPSCMDVNTHKVSGKLIICLAIQSSRASGAKTEEGDGDFCVLIIEIDQNNDYAKKELVRRRINSPQITKLIYRPEYGLIVGCFRGYIELFDSIEFESRGVWDNNTKITFNKGKKPCDKKQRSQMFTGDDKSTLQKRFQLDITGLEDWIQTQLIEFDDHVQEPIDKAGIQKEKVQLAVSKAQDEQQKHALVSGRGNSKQSSIQKKKAPKKCVETVDCLDYSQALGLIAFGGIQGKVVVLDSTTLSFTGMYQAHSCEMEALFFYDKQLQMLTMSVDGEISLWDGQKMCILQTVKNSKFLCDPPSTTLADLANDIRSIQMNGRVKREEAQQTNGTAFHFGQQSEGNSSKQIITASTFFTKTGTMYLGSSKIFRWALQEDTSTRIQIEHQNATAQDFMRQYVQGLKTCGVLAGESKHDTMDVANIRAEINRVFQPENMTLLSQKDSGSVLASRKTKLVGVFLNPFICQLFTLDTNCLVRQWDLKTGACLKSYPLEVHSAKNQNSKEGLEVFKTKRKLHLAKLHKDCKLLLVAFDGGLIQINNVFSGQILFNKNIEETLQLEHEVTNLAFFSSQTNYFVTATCWEGRVVFMSKPQQQKGREFITFKTRRSGHKRDISCLDINEVNQMVTGSIDNVLCLWNSFTGQVTKQVQIPASMADLTQGNFIQSVKFASQETNEHLLVIMSCGDIYVMETQTETFICPTAATQHQKGESANKSMNKYSVARIPQNSIVDFQRNMIVSVSETGSGTFHVLSYTDGKRQAARSRDFPSTSKLRVEIDFKHAFNVAERELPQSQSVFQVQLQCDYSLFIVSQTDGGVKFFNFQCQLVSQLNKGGWNGARFASLQHDFKPKFVNHNTCQLFDELEALQVDVSEEEVPYAHSDRSVEGLNWAEKRKMTAPATTRNTKPLLFSQREDAQRNNFLSDCKNQDLISEGRELQIGTDLNSTQAKTSALSPATITANKQYLHFY